MKPDNHYEKGVCERCLECVASEQFTQKLEKRKRAILMISEVGQRPNYWEETNERSPTVLTAEEQNPNI
ncbi:5111_t:CDS:2 [Cetraspora pellucida]|uniref:5111_t:CDS:1 n=1 Tax=Cetraspora pellucida TaxID=1433469 RepID=A0A9N9BY39_9GLOM|nr:5111_t:CDS:2 [Cetraspora pellucida]